MTSAQPASNRVAHGVRIDRVRDERLDVLLRGEVVEAGAAPAAVVGFAERSTEGWSVRVGAAGAAQDAPFDLASVTKPLTAIAAMQLVAEGRWSRATTVGEAMPELRQSAAAAARLEDLLSHRAGLPPWGALYREDPWSVGVGRSEPPCGPLPPLSTMLARAASRVDPTSTGASAPAVYSDLGYVLVGAMLARVAGESLATQWERISPATSASRRRACEVGFDAHVPPTEHVPWRGGEVRGVVHDENAFMLERAGGEPGHAGAFGSLDDVLGVAMKFVDLVARPASLGPSPLLPAALAREMIAPFAVGSHRLGWDGVTAGASSAGRRFGPRSFGHLGFTGTSVWADPDACVVVALLTNRTFPSRENMAIRAARPRVHDALWALYRGESEARQS